MANTTWPEHEWRSVMNHWLEGKTHLDPEDIFSDDEYGLLNAAKFAMLVFINKSANSSNSTVNGTSENESGLFSSELEENNVSESEISNSSNLQNISKEMSKFLGKSCYQFNLGNKAPEPSGNNI